MEYVNNGIYQNSMAQILEYMKLCL